MPAKRASDYDLPDELLGHARVQADKEGKTLNEWFADALLAYLNRQGYRTSSDGDTST
jgi:hypothetical protein